MLLRRPCHFSICSPYHKLLRTIQQRKGYLIGWRWMDHNWLKINSYVKETRRKPFLYLPFTKLMPCIQQLLKIFCVNQKILIQVNNEKHLHRYFELNACKEKFSWWAKLICLLKEKLYIWKCNSHYSGWEELWVLFLFRGRALWDNIQFCF